MSNIGLIGHWLGSPVFGDRIPDLVGNNHGDSGTFTHPTRSPNGHMTTVNDFQFADRANYRWTNGFSVSCWSCFHAGYGGDLGYAFSFGNIGESAWTAASWGYGGTHQVYLFSTYSGSYQQLVTSAITIPLHQMTHWAFTLQPTGASSTQATIYRNGLNIATTSHAGTFGTGSVTGRRVGNYLAGSYPTKADMTDFRLYNRAIRQEEVKQLWLRGPTVMGSDPVPRPVTYRGVSIAGAAQSNAPRVYHYMQQMGAM